MVDRYDRVRHIRFIPCEDVPKGTVVITTEEDIRMVRGPGAALAHVRKGLIGGVIVEHVGVHREQ